MQSAVARPPATSPLLPSSSSASGRRLKLLIAGGSILLGVCYLVITALQTSTVYYITVGELLQRGASAYNQQVRVAGHVVPGTVERIDAGLGVKFQVYDASGDMPVLYHGGVVPDIFGDEVEVVVEGKYGQDGTFVASTLLAKCPSKFETDTAADPAAGV